MDKAVILSDFDGTITIKDTNSILFKEYNKNKFQEIKNEYNENYQKLGVRWLLSEQYKNIKISREEFNSFVLKNIKIEPDFPDFLDFIRENNFEFAVISSGFLDYINLLFDNNCINLEFKVYANRLRFLDGSIETDYIHGEADCLGEYGPAANRKDLIIDSYKGKDVSVFYLGDGTTDRQAIGRADYILPKRGTYLEEYCLKNNIECFPFKNFKEAEQIIKGKLL